MEKLQFLIDDTTDWCWFDAELPGASAVGLLVNVHCRIPHGVDVGLALGY